MKDDVDGYIIDKVTADLIRIELLVKNIREHLKSYATYKEVEITIDRTYTTQPSESATRNS